jgi:hypothetical protein
MQFAKLVKSAREMRGVREHLAAVLDNLSDDLVAEVRDFANFCSRNSNKSKVARELIPWLIDKVG